MVGLRATKQVVVPVLLLVVGAAVPQRLALAARQQRI
jgi:hypothetical protein